LHPDRVRVGISLLSQDHQQFTGTGTYVRELIRELGRRPDQVELEILCNEHAIELLHGWAPEGAEIKVATGYRIGSSRVSRVAAIAGASLRRRSLQAQLSPGLDVVHYPLTLNVPPVAGPSVMTLHDIQHHELPEMFSTAQRLWRRVVYDRAAARSTIVITDSYFSRDRIVELVGVDPERIVAVHLGVDHERFNPAPAADDEELLAALRLPERFVLYPASLWPHKNHARLLDALARVGDDSLHLLLTGAPFGRLEQLVALADRLGIAGRVRHVRFVSDAALPALYRRADALVFPSLYEGFGAPPLEAMACGCPVASSLATSLAEVCGDAVEPLEPLDPDQMAGAITRVVADEDLRAGLRRRGLAQARKFSWARAADAHLQVYRRAAGSQFARADTDR
jgi:glycosyltransferase involved in cell wall biosynthesis